MAGDKDKDKSGKSVRTGDPSGLDLALEVLDSTLKGTILSLEKGKVVIGSADFADLTLSQKSVSPIHTVIEKQPDGRVVLYDMASKTGTFVNGKKAVQQDLNTGDEVKVGFTTLVLRGAAEKTKSTTKHSPSISDAAVRAGSS